MLEKDNFYKMRNEIKPLYNFDGKTFNRIYKNYIEFFFKKNE